MAKYGIKVDYYHWSEEKGMYTLPLYLYTDRSPKKILIFDERTDREDIDLRLFNTKEEAEEYMVSHGWYEYPQCSFENPRVVEFKISEKCEVVA